MKALKTSAANFASENGFTAVAKEIKAANNVVDIIKGVELVAGSLMRNCSNPALVAKMESTLKIFKFRAACGL